MSDAVQVLIVDDERSIRDTLVRALARSGLSAIAVSELAEARTKLDGVDAVLLDIRLRDTNGLELYRELKRRGFVPPVIFMTGHGDIALAVQAMKDGALDFVTKPLDDQKLLDSVQFARAKGYMAPLTAAELELMNLTGDGNGFDMVTMPREMRARVPTANFFQRSGYERNPVARRTKVVAGLIAEIQSHINLNSATPGARDLAAAF